MRLIVTAIAAIAVVGCEQADNILEQPQVTSNMQVPEVKGACEYFIHGVIDELESLQETLAPDHPDVRKFESLIRRQLIECYYPQHSVALPDDAPPNSTPFSFNGHTYVFVPLSSIGEQASPSEQITIIDQATARN